LGDALLAVAQLGVKGFHDDVLALGGLMAQFYLAIQSGDLLLGFGQFRDVLGDRLGLGLTVGLEFIALEGDRLPLRYGLLPMFLGRA
jgi:hypothetical protein